MQERNEMLSQTKPVMDFFVQVYQMHETQAILNLFAGDYIEHHANGATSNRRAIEIVESTLETFPDLFATVEDAVQQGNTVAVRAAFSGTHKSSFLGCAPTGKRIAWEAMEFFVVKDGKITESWGAWPLYDMLQKIQAL